MTQKKVYDNEFKIQAVKLGREIGFSKAAKELGSNILCCASCNQTGILLIFNAPRHPMEI